MEEVSIVPLEEYEDWVGAFIIECAYKIEKASHTEWHCVSKAGEIVLVYYKSGFISFKYGETEYEAHYNDKIYLVGSTIEIDTFGEHVSTKLLALLKKSRSEIPPLNITQIFDWMMWEYRLGYV